MPPGRQARANTAAASKPKTARQKSQKRTLDAFAIAGHDLPQKSTIAKHRLGEAVDDGSRQKRRRVDDDADQDDQEDHHTIKRRHARDDDVDQGSDSDGNEWRMGGPIGDDSDSSIDSDEAFGESDEEKFEGFTFRGSSSNKPGAQKKARAKAKARQPTSHMDLDEGSDSEHDQDESEDENDDFGDEGVDLATMLDYNSESEDEAPPKKKKQSQDLSDDDDDDTGDDNDDDDESDDDDQDSDSPPSEAESDDTDPTKLSKLQDLIASLDQDQPEKRVGRPADLAESQQPSAFGLSASQKLKISDLLPTVTDPSLRKSLKLLSSDKTSKRSVGPGKLDAPLPKRQQDKLDRQAATQKAKEELDKWRDTVVHNRRAEFLQFPLKDPNASDPLGKKTMIAVQQEQPQNDLESAIQNILVESGLGAKGKPGDEEAQIQEFEELKMNKIPIEEVMARRAELRKARELLFREESKAKRIKKIKSKAYRRVHRREREREAQKDQDMKDAEGIETDEDEKEKRDRKRAEERMGTKHRDSKWAKGMKKSGRTVWDDDARDSMIELARRNEDLRKRIEGKDVRDRESGDSDFSDQDDDDDDDDEDMDDEEVGKKRLAKKLDRLDASRAEHSKLGNMLFMQRADAARKAQNDEEILRLKQELADLESASEQEEDTAVGRRSFGPKDKKVAAPLPKSARTEMEENAASDEERVVEDDDAEIIVERPATNGDSTGRKPRPLMAMKSEKAVTSEADGADWLTAEKKHKKSKAKEPQDETAITTELVPAKLRTLESQTKSKKQSKSAKANESTAASTNGWTTIPYNNGADQDTPTDQAEDETWNPMVLQKDKQASFHQRAFAGDEVDSDFTADKAAQVIDEDDKVTSTHLPGWGSWTGDGLSKAARKQNQRLAHNPLRKSVVEGVRAANRKDAKLDNVIISEAQQRKSKKYLASTLPHQFERREQYERSLRIPVGPEWTTKETFQRNTRPRVVVKQGIVEPMEKPIM